MASQARLTPANQNLMNALAPSDGDFFGRFLQPILCPASNQPNVSLFPRNSAANYSILSILNKPNFRCALRYTNTVMWQMS